MPAAIDRSDAAPVVSVQHALKRDGETLQPFDKEKVKSAVRKAWAEGGGEIDEKFLNKIVTSATSDLTEAIVCVEDVQDAVETALMKHKQFAAAKAYILYRHQRTEARKGRTEKAPDPKAISDYIHAGKYARYLPLKKRREVYEETVARVEGMHLSVFPQMESEIRWAFDLVRQKKVLPSMRSMQFGGDAILANNNRIFNCSFTHIDRPDVFGEALYLLLSGCGVGYSVQFDHVDRLPELVYVDVKKVRHHVIEDTIEGWADALKALFQSFLEGVNLEFSYHLIRPAGTSLRTSGGKAPGHLKLKESLERIRGVLSGAMGRKLRPVECHRILCHAADAVLSGGIRRSAMICLFSLDDGEMMQLKTGDWYVKEPWFANANNSVVLKRDEVKKKQFKRIFKMTRQWGEPGFYFTEHYDYGTNPCSEIGMFPKITVAASLQSRLAERGITVSLGQSFSGWAFCNLCEINAALLTCLQDFKDAAKAAAIIGTLQAGYTTMPYLGWVSEEIAKRDALLGIGMTGMMDAPEISCNPDYQREVAALIKEWNTEYAARIGVNPAARTTCVKPSGTTSLELGCVASGHHPHHARRQLRRVTADELENVFQAFKAVNPHMCVRKPDGKYVIEFPVQAPPGAMIKEDLSALKFLSMVRSTQQNWVVPGTADETHAPGLNHNVSNTVTVKPEEWEEVSEYLWDNRAYFTGVSLLASTGDKDFAYAPNESIETVADEARWNAILENYKPVDYTSMVENDDATDLKGEVACMGGVCSLV